MMFGLFKKKVKQCCGGCNTNHTETFAVTPAMIREAALNDAANIVGKMADEVLREYLVNSKSIDAMSEFDNGRNRALLDAANAIRRLKNGKQS